MSTDKNKDHTEQWLVSGLKHKNTGAFEILYDRYSPALYGVIKRIVLDEKVAEEVTHDAFLKIWEKADSYDSNKGRLFTWMLRIARNLAIDKTRSRNFKELRKTDSESENVYTIDQLKYAKQNPDDIGVRDLLANLNEDQKLVLDLLYFRGYSQSEVSKEFGIPLGTVKTRTRAALQQLRKILNQ